MNVNENQNVKSKSDFDYLVAFIWVVNGIGLYIKEIAIRVFGESLGTIAFNLLILYFIIWYIFKAKTYISKNTNKNTLKFIMAFFLAFMLSIIFYPQNFKYLSEYIPFICTVAVPMFLIGSIIRVEEATMEKLKYSSFIVIICHACYYFYSIYTGKVVNEHELGFIGLILPSLLLIIGYYYAKNKILKFILSLFFSIFVSILLGSRGAIVCIIIFTLFILCKNLNLKKTIILIILSVILILPLYFSNGKFISNIAQLVAKLSGSSRVVDFMEKGDFFHDENRIAIIKEFWNNAILQKPLFGWGMFGDRIACNNIYPHNIIIEMLVQYGFVFGLVFISCLFIGVFKSYKNEQNKYMIIYLCILIVLGFVRKFMSGTYLDSAEFFALIGYIACNKKQS